MHLLRLWFGLDVPVSRRAYAASGFGLMAFKYLVEGLVLEQGGAPWPTPWTFLSPMVKARTAGLDPGAYAAVVVFLALWSLPFLWIGITMSLRRSEAAGYSPLLCLFFLVPMANYVLMLALCLLPDRPRTAAPVAPAVHTDASLLRRAFVGVAWGVALALIMVVASVLVFGAYGTTLFVATPFAMGLASAVAFNRPTRHSLGATQALASLTTAVAGATILVFALEGVVCLLMAAPLGFPMAWMGAAVGRHLATRLRPWRTATASLLLPLPLFPAVERPVTEPRVVLTSVEIARPPDRVWPSVIAFSDLPEPQEWAFRSGIAYPVRATIQGQGVGAVRYCEFSTGPFVEPITAWEPPHRLAFDVASQPPPLQEWSPYRHVLAPHLDGYLHVERGEFRLLPSPTGGTLVEGRTWYRMQMAPAAYWQLWSDLLIHSIHSRVLQGIRTEAEREPYFARSTKRPSRVSTRIFSPASM